MKKMNRLPNNSRLLKALSILCLVIFLVSFNACKSNEQETSKVDSADVMSGPENSSQVDAFVTFIANDTNKMTLDHAYTNEALLKLTDATEAVANRIGYSSKEDISKVREYAAKITSDPFETTHADNIRKSTDIIATILQNMQQANYPDLGNDIADLKTASASVNPDVRTLEQKDAVKSFFSKAADVLQKMN